MSNLVNFQSANLPSVDSIATALRSVDIDVGAGGTVILKMDKTGHWVFGADQTEVDEDATWAVNPYSFTHGYIAWGGDDTPAAGTVLGEMMASVSDPLPETPAAPAHSTLGWQKQVGMSLKCLSGEDEGMEARYAATSVGGKKGWQNIAIAIAEQVKKDPSKPVPVIQLVAEPYKHKKYGKIFNPIFKVVDWMSMDGKAEEAEALAEEAPAAEAAPARRRRG